MSGARIASLLRVSLSWALLLLVVVGCQVSEPAVPRQFAVEWTAGGMLFVADERIGQVKAFRTVPGAAPVLVAQSHVFERSRVRDLTLDADRGRLWVLGPDALYLHALGNLGLRRRIPLQARAVAGLALADGVLLLYAASGELLGRVDPDTLLAEWAPAGRLG